MSRFERLCQLGRRVGCANICTCAYMPPEIEALPVTEAYRGSPPLQVRAPNGFNWDAFWGSAVARVVRMARVARRHGQNLIVEDRVGDFVSTSDGVLKLIEDADEPKAGCPPDVAHTHASKEHIDLVIPKLSTHLMYVHLADNDGTHSYHLPAGCGNTDFPAVFRGLRSIHYDGYFNVDYGGVPSEQILTEVTEGRKYFVECSKKFE